MQQPEIYLGFAADLFDKNGKATEQSERFFHKKRWRFMQIEEKIIQIAHFVTITD